MKKTILYAGGVVVVLLTTGCKSREAHTQTVAYHNYETECLGVGMDGNRTLRVWASGRNKFDAVEQACKKAVYDVVFTGITAGSGDCNAFPLVSEANARGKYEAYFDKFFSDGGAYRKYVTTSGQSKSGRDVFQGKGSVMYGITVTVNRSELRQRLEADNIIVNSKK
ncbi:MAG: hypothetical protein NC388_01365 [Clostridium sp.]|nr:hypothetical protein [Clostridium sp.]